MSNQAKITYKEARELDRKLTKDDLGEMHHKEVMLLLAIRERFRWGKIEIHAKDGIPLRILRAFESDDL